MSLDDRMQDAFGDRLQTLENTVTITHAPTPTPTPGSTPPARPGFRTFGPWLAGGVAAALLVIGGVVLFSGGDDANTIVADEPTTIVLPTTTTADTGISTTEPAQSAPSTTATPDTTAAPTTVATTEPSIASTVAKVTPTTCAANRYNVTLAAGWFHESCALFSPEPVVIPGEAEYRPEIDMTFTTTELYAQALARINSDLTVVSQSATTVDGLPATIFVVEEEWWDTGLRTVYVVDAGDGVFFASANELADSQATITDFDAHYAASVTALQNMMGSVSITPGVQKTAACPGPSLSNPSSTISVSADINNDGSTDQVSIIRHANGAHIVADAGSAGILSGPIGFVDPFVGGDILRLTDLDGDGIRELFSSTSSSAAGSNFEAFYVNGCSIDPIGGVVQPALEQRASVAAAVSFSCLPAPSGEKLLDNYRATIDNNTGLFDNNYRQFQYSNGQWNLLTETDTQGTDPVVGPGVDSCS